MTVRIPASAVSDANTADAGLALVLLALAGPESGWNPGAVGDGGCSLGYLQLNRCGGLGAGYSETELLDGVTNFGLGAAYIRERLATGASLYDALEPWSARPAAWALYQRITAEGIESAGPTPTAAGLPVGVGVLVGLVLVLWLMGG